MNEEKKSEIIKSLAYGMTAEKIASLEDVTVEEVEQVRKDCTDEIADKKSWLEKRYG